MFLKNTNNGDLVEVLSISDLVDPCRNDIAGRYHAGEEMQEPAAFNKSELVFPSGESLPACWTDPGYKA